MSDIELKTHLRMLTQEAVQRSQTSDSQLQPGHGGMALYNQQRDAQVAELPAFAPAVTALASLAEFTTIAAPSEATRVVLQFVYDYLKRQNRPDFDEGAYERTWASFWEELAKPEWTYLGICYLENLESDADTVELGDGVAVHNRSTYPFREVGWNDFQIEKLHEDWRGTSFYVLVAEAKSHKTPDNLILHNGATPVTKAQRMLQALRLAKEGDVHIGGTLMIGRILTTRPAGDGFSPSPGAAMHGQTMRWFGAKYLLTASEAPYVLTMYNELQTIEAMGAKAPYNLSLALRSFASSYDRVPAYDDTRLVDLITAAEALVGTSIEISFRLSFRIAGILAESDDERLAIFHDVRDFYDTRSRVVHGQPLEAKHRTHLEDYPVLRGYVRRLLTAFMHLATTPGHQYGSESLRKRLDSILQDRRQLAALRGAMGLEQGL